MRTKIFSESILPKQYKTEAVFLQLLRKQKHRRNSADQMPGLSFALRKEKLLKKAKYKNFCKLKQKKKHSEKIF